MFLFLKNKKGFTLVELMIVVVIMAILVAVAVPIYGAVTSNARKKTCAGNRRTIVESITTAGMNNPENVESGTMKLTTNSTGDGFSSIDVGDVLENEDAFLALFQEKNLPCCPSENNVITVEVEKNSSDNSFQISVYCSEHEPKS